MKSQTEQIRQVLAQMIGRRTEIRVELSNVLVAGDVALAAERWRIRSAGVDGARFEQTVSPTLVLRHVEAEWKLMIAALWGWRGRQAELWPAGR